MISNATNRRYRLRSRPVGPPTAADLELVPETVPAPGDGAALLRNRYLSLDPANRVWMSDAPSYVEPVGIGEVMRGVGIGEVVESRRDDMTVGDLVLGYTGWQDYAIACGPGEHMPWTVLPSPPPVDLPVLLGTLGHTGVSAYLGLELFGRPQPGETVVVSAAAGATGSVAGQIAKARGARVVGITGGPVKARHLVDELGFDAAVDRHAGDWREQLAAATPDGVDVDFENVGGEIMDAVILRANRGARIVVCGLISIYDRSPDELRGGHWTILNLITRRATLHGFLLPDYRDQVPAGVRYLSELLAAGRLRSTETVVDGLENALDAYHELFRGTTIGKTLIKISD